MSVPEGSTTIMEYLTQLAESPAMVEAYRKNPERAMTQAGLSAADRDSILKGDLETIRQAIQADTPVAFMVWLARMVW